MLTPLVLSDLNPRSFLQIVQGFVTRLCLAHPSLPRSAARSRHNARIDVGKDILSYPRRQLEPDESQARASLLDAGVVIKSKDASLYLAGRFHAGLH